MPNERLDEVLNASNLLQIHPLQKFTPPSPPQSSEATETNQPTTNSQQQQQQQQQSHPQLPSQEINPNPLPILLPPPYHEYAVNGESSLMTSLPGEPQIPSPLNRTPPPPYNPDQLNYVQPKNNLRRIQPRTKVNRWVYIVLATCAGSLLLGIMKFIIVLQASVYHKNYHN